MIVHQVGSVLSTGDAVTNHIFEIDRRLRGWGLTTRIYGADISGVPGSRAERDEAYAQQVDNPADLLIYHYSAYCDNYRLFQRAAGRKILVYHNITPAEYFRPYDARYASLCGRGRAVLTELAACDLALGVSEYNRAELLESGFAAARTGVLPLFLGESTFASVAADPAFLRRLRRDGLTTLLFVGKVAPNKALEDVIKIFAAYHRHVNPRSQLLLAGPRFLPLYDAVLDGLVSRLGLEGAVSFTGRIPVASLRACYEAANLFLCASRHEGFCAPLLEAMYFKLPILARACAAVPGTLGDAGILYDTLAYPQLAELIAAVLADDALRQRIIEGQQRRLSTFASPRVEAMLRDALGRVGVVIPEGAPAP